MNKPKELTFYTDPDSKPCRLMGHIINSIIENTNISVTTINVNNEPKTAREHLIDKLPTFTTKSRDNALKRLTGCQTYTELKDFCN